MLELIFVPTVNVPICVNRNRLLMIASGTCDRSRRTVTRLALHQQAVAVAARMNLAAAM
ncbi:MAG: hypothetical protein U1D30_08590 [Planctomycetota bacterium]